MKEESESSYEEKHEDFVRQQNEHCFLKDKQKIKYHSFILLELVPLEKFNQLIFGLDKLYANASESQKERLDYDEILSKSHLKLFQWNTLNLPYVTTSKLKNKVLPDCVFHDLGENIRHIKISVFKVMPSTVVLQIKVYLDDKISEKINGIIYKYHEEIRKSVETPRGEYTKIYSPENQKEFQIYKFRKDLHKEAIEFLKKYFEGYFFELSKEDTPIVPSIDLFSLEYPTKENDFLDWSAENIGFFQCFSTNIIPYFSFKYQNYLLCYESKRSDEFNNYLIFANRKTSMEDMYPDVDVAIEEKLNFCSFDLIAIERWVKTQEGVVGELNSKISEEISKIQQNKFSKALETRKAVQKSVFSFQRFLVEYNEYGFIPDKFAFKSIKDKRNPERQVDLFESLKEGIEMRINEINTLIDGFTRQYEAVLNLKNLEYNKNMQLRVLILTILIIVLALVQFILSPYIAPKISELIAKLYGGG